MQAPLITEIKNIQLPTIDQDALAMGAPIYYMHDKEARYVRFEAVFNAGRRQEAKLMTSKGCALLFKEGTKSLSAREVAEYYDGKGSSLQIRNSLDHIFVSFVCLKEYAEDLIRITSSICFEPSFKQESLDKVIRRQRQRLSNELSKTEVIAYREMTEMIFGQKSAYGYNSTREKYDNLEVDSIVDFHKKNILHGKASFFLTGCITDNLITVLKGSFADHAEHSTTNGLSIPKMLNSAVHKELPLAGSVQNSLRLFKPIFSRYHDDYSQFFLLNTILGGYFGSRLMKNIREKEGLTYGIYSGTDFLFQCGYFYISTETQPQNLVQIKKLIHDELDKLCTIPIEKEELLTAKRYVSGQFLRMVDGPLNVMKVNRTLALNGLDSDFYSTILSRIWEASPESLIELSQKYLNPNSLSTVVVGSKS